jgi:hypothetical protein
MSQEELLAKVAAVLKAAGVPYVVTGSVATALYGEPRFTQDADAADIDSSLRRGIISNIIDGETGAKVDLHPKKDDPFEDSFFARRRAVKVGNVDLWFPSPEDAILSKLRWARATGDGERHVADAAGVYKVQKDALDLAYLKDWAERLGFTDLLAGIGAPTDEGER